MARESFDQMGYKTHEGCRVNYGILHGNSTVVLIKSGAGGNCKGFENKHLKMAMRLHDVLGCSVICASNPCDWDKTYQVDKTMITQYAAHRGFLEYEVYLVGTSDGAYQILDLAKELPQTKKLLGVNPSMGGFERFLEKLQALPQVEKHLVYGTKDHEVEYLPLLKKANVSCLHLHTVEEADHQFTHRLEEYVALGDLLR